MKNWYKNQKGSMAVYVAVSMLSFIVILTGIFLTSASVRNNQLKTISKIKEVYEKDSSNKQTIYEQRKLLDVSSYVSDGIILHYDGINNSANIHDNNATIWKDLSGNGNDGELQNFSNTVESGWISNGLSLDGTDDGVFLGDKLIDLYKNDATIEIVLNFANDNNRDIIFGNYTLTLNETSINIERGSSLGEVPYKCRFFYKNGQIDYLTTNDFFKENKKITFTCVFDKTNTTVTFFANGEEQETVTNSLFSENYDFINAWIGRDGRTGDTALNGTIYSVRIYNRVLTQNELINNYQTDKERY